MVKVSEFEIQNRRKKKFVNHDKLFDVIVTAVMIFTAALFLLPLLYVLSCSFTDPDVVLTGKASLFPIGFTTTGYVKVFQNKLLLSGFKNSLIYTGIGTLISVTIQMLCAYPLSRKDFKLRGPINFVFVLTMFIGGGMIPNYLLIVNLHMLNTMWAVILPACCSVFSIVVVRTYMENSISYELQEAARVDGCSDFGIFIRIILPLCRPILFVITLFAIVGFWNSYFSALLYLSDTSLFPLQRVLQDILVVSESNVGGEEPAVQEQLKYVTIVVSSLPLLIIYPFFQKYFEKGMTIGGMKG